MKIIVGMADMQGSREPEAMIISFALGSCIGITLYDPLIRVGGLLHFMLPDSQIDPRKSQKNPWMFADTGIPLFFLGGIGLMETWVDFRGRMQKPLPQS